MKTKLLQTILFVLIFSSCKSNKELSCNEHVQDDDFVLIKITNQKQEINDTTFVNLKSYSNDFVYDMKYATSDNFLKSKVYDCAECYLRLKTVQSLIRANKKFMDMGYRIKLFDCYRPLEIQKKMWKIISNPDFVANPSTGSIHNRGGAVDLTLVDSFGNSLNMGTDFDFFGKEASHNYKELPKKVLNNRKLLKETMVKNGFKIFNSEWWHYDLENASKDKIANFKWNCD